MLLSRKMNFRVLLSQQKLYKFSLAYKYEKVHSFQTSPWRINNIQRQLFQLLSYSLNCIEWIYLPTEQVNSALKRISTTHEKKNGSGFKFEVIWWKWIWANICTWNRFNYHKMCNFLYKCSIDYWSAISKPLNFMNAKWMRRNAITLSGMRA